MFVGNCIEKEIETTIYAPSFPYQGHTITNLAKHQLSYLKARQSNHTNSQEETICKERKKVNYFHLGNSSHNFEVLRTYVDSDALLNILIIHDTNLTDLFLYALKVKKDSNIFGKLLRNQSPMLIIKLLRDQSLSQAEKNSFFLNALMNSGLKQPVIVVHNSKELRLLENQFKNRISKIPLPIGYHFFKTSPSTLENEVPLLLFCFPALNDKLSKVIKDALIEVYSRRRVRVVIAGSSAGYHEAMFRSLSFVKVLREIKNENWSFLLRRSDVAIRLGAGNNGESSGFIRDGIMLADVVLGDENCETLSRFANYFIITTNQVYQDLANQILDAINRPRESSKVKDEDESLRLATISLQSYFRSLEDLAEKWIT